MTTIGFIGGGKMAEALIARLSGWKIIVSDIDSRRPAYLKKQYRVRTARSNGRLFDAANVVVLAVKPQNIAEVLEGLRVKGQGSRVKKMVISIVAGIPIKYLQKKLPGCRIVRAMPNNPALVGQGITALARGKGVAGSGLGIAKKIFGAVGEVVAVPEKWLDAVTGLSGSGPAFVYLVTEALAAGGVKAGLPARVAERLAAQTVLGAAVTVKKSGHTPRQLREMVASPGGTTREGLAVLAKRKMLPALREAVVAAARRARSLSKQWAR